MSCGPSPLHGSHLNPSLLTARRSSVSRGPGRLTATLADEAHRKQTMVTSDARAARGTRLSHRRRPDGRPGATCAARSRHGASRLEPSFRRASRLVGRRTRRTRPGETESDVADHGTPVRQLNVAAQDRPALDLHVHPLRGRPGDHRPRCRLRAILRRAARCQARGARAPKLIQQAAGQVMPSHDTTLRFQSLFGRCFQAGL